MKTYEYLVSYQFNKGNKIGFGNMTIYSRKIRQSSDIQAIKSFLDEEVDTNTVILNVFLIGRNKRRPE